MCDATSQIWRQLERASDFGAKFGLQSGKTQNKEPEEVKILVFNDYLTDNDCLARKRLVETGVSHMYIHACIHAYIHTCMHTCIHTYMHICTHAYICTCTYMHTYVIHTYVHEYIHTYIYLCDINTYILMYIHTCIHT
jgi:hypothetical protein